MSNQPVKDGKESDSKKRKSNYLFTASNAKFPRNPVGMTQLDITFSKAPKASQAMFPEASQSTSQAAKPPPSATITSESSGSAAQTEKVENALDWSVDDDLLEDLVHISSQYDNIPLDSLSLTDSEKTESSPEVAKPAETSPKQKSENDDEILNAANSEQLATENAEGATVADLNGTKATNSAGDALQSANQPNLPQKRKHATMLSATDSVPTNQEPQNAILQDLGNEVDLINKLHISTPKPYMPPERDFVEAERAKPFYYAPYLVEKEDLDQALQLENYTIFEDGLRPGVKPFIVEDPKTVFYVKILVSHCINKMSYMTAKFMINKRTDTRTNEDMVRLYIPPQMNWWTYKPLGDVADWYDNEVHSDLRKCVALLIHIFNIQPDLILEELGIIKWPELVQGNDYFRSLHQEEIIDDEEAMVPIDTLCEEILAKLWKPIHTPEMMCDSGRSESSDNWSDELEELDPPPVACSSRSLNDENGNSLSPFKRRRTDYSLLTEFQAKCGSTVRRIPLLDLFLNVVDESINYQDIAATEGAICAALEIWTTFGVNDYMQYASKMVLHVFKYMHKLIMTPRILLYMIKNVTKLSTYHAAPLIEYLCIKSASSGGHCCTLRYLCQVAKTILMHMKNDGTVDEAFSININKIIMFHPNQLIYSESYVRELLLSLMQLFEALMAQLRTSDVNLNFDDSCGCLVHLFMLTFSETASRFRYNNYKMKGDAALEKLTLSMSEIVYATYKPIPLRFEIYSFAVCLLKNNQEMLTSAQAKSAAKIKKYFEDNSLASTDAQDQFKFVTCKALFESSIWFKPFKPVMRFTLSDQQNLPFYRHNPYYSYASYVPKKPAKKCYAIRLEEREAIASKFAKLFGGKGE